MRCEICGSSENLCSDHDHQTGLIRGILCRSCNFGIGHLRDDFSLCKKAASYLEKNRSEDVLLLEAERCKSMIELLNQEIARLPKGSLHKRIKLYRESQYEYYYLKYRDGERSVSQHVAKQDVGELIKKIDRRNALIVERSVYTIRLKQIFYKGVQENGKETIW